MADEQDPTQEFVELLDKAAEKLPEAKKLAEELRTSGLTEEIRPRIVATLETYEEVLRLERDALKVVRDEAAEETAAIQAVEDEVTEEAEAVLAGTGEGTVSPPPAPATLTPAEVVVPLAAPPPAPPSAPDTALPAAVSPPTSTWQKVEPPGGEAGGPAADPAAPTPTV
ncbi:hypothetical protein HY375_02255 [Candidatus Berkelbacteria bacterium]|nr:hypothetical protein [Candidatus Berkelbacteria bacterium]